MGELPLIPEAAGIEAEKVDGVKLVQNEIQVVATTAAWQTEKRDDRIRDPAIA